MINLADFEELMEYSANAETQTMFSKGITHFRRAKGKKIAVAISGGSDSDIVLDVVEHLRDDHDITYVFYNTGLEYEATKRHLKYLEDKYNIEILEEKAIKPIPTCCQQYGVPFLSKYVSEMIGRLQAHNFQWEDEPYEVLVKKYPNCQVGLKWWCNANPPTKTGKPSSFNISRDRLLKEFMLANPPTFKISNKCCHYAKKLPAEKFLTKGGYGLNITGVRQAEGGIRAREYSTCFYSSSDNKKDYDIWMPLFWFSDQDKKEYDDFCGIIHSDCYVIYGLTRTGCAGCPFNSDFEEELEVIRECEPRLYKAVMNIFGQSYEYARTFKKFKEEYRKQR